MSAGQRFIRTLIVVVLDVVSAAAALIPWRLGVAIGGTIGRVAWYALPSTRRTALDNLAMAFPDLSEQERARIGRASLANLGRAAMELLMLWRRPGTPVERWCAFDDEDRLRDALAPGRGAIFVTGHTGNWELLAAVVARRGYPLSVVATPVYDDRIDQRLVGARAVHGIETIRRGSAAAGRQLLSALRRNAVLGMLIDQDTDVDGVFVPFFGRLAYTPAGAAALALRTDARVVCGFLVREGASRHRVVLEGPIDLVRTGETDQDVLENTRRFTDLIERHNRTYPDQWIWFHRRWKRRPKSATTHGAVASPEPPVEPASP
ncbi:MAG TPA: lysophospholipid acyltransferase family protein, partial [Nitrospiria bacterium]|nr:lysophospholipid acyltransferase family protein [Nitrospiria bacterium]